MPIVAGGIEASLRRLAGPDYWSDTVRRAIMLDAKADLVVFGMGEQQIVTIANRLAAGETVKDSERSAGSPSALGASESQSPAGRCDRSRRRLKKSSPTSTCSHGRPRSSIKRPTRLTPNGWFNIMIARPSCAIRPPLPITQDDMDRIYGLPYTRKPHPMYKGQKIPAYEVVKDSVTIMRGCFGGCTFCSITAHQGRIIQSRPSSESVLTELRPMGQDPGFSGVVSDIGGPTANMYQMKCTRPEVEAKCKRLSCVHPKICKLLGTDHGPLVDLMRKKP